MHWFKIHHGFSSNPKLGLIAHKLKKSRAEINAIFIDLLEYASKNAARGSIDGYDEETASFNLGLDIEPLRNAVTLLRPLLLNWDEYQQPIDRTNSERQKRYRDKKKQELDNEVTDSNALRNTDKNRIDKKEYPLTPKGEFAAFWKIYPKKTGKGQAEKAYNKAIKKTSHDVIMSAVVKILPKWQSMDIQYVPHASTWLNGERWEDEVIAKPKSKGPSLC